MKILVTGADGFLGSSIIDELTRRRLPIKAFLQEGRRIDSGRRGVIR